MSETSPSNSRRFAAGHRTSLPIVENGTNLPTNVFPKSTKLVPEEPWQENALQTSDSNARSPVVCEYRFPEIKIRIEYRRRESTMHPAIPQYSFNLNEHFEDGIYTAGLPE